MKKIIVALALIAALVAGCGRTGGIETFVSKKNDEWHVEVRIIAPFANRDDLAREAVDKARIACLEAMDPPQRPPTFLSPQSDTVRAIVEEIVRILSTTARWRGPCSALWSYLGPQSEQDQGG